MSLEAQIAELNTNIKALVVAIGSAFAAGAMATATLAETGTQPAKTDDKPAKDTKTSDKPKADSKPKAEDKKEATGPDWKVVLEKIKELNNSKEDGHGRGGILALLKQFGIPDGEKVPALEKLNKHAEVLAWVEARLKGEADGGDADDLGI